MAIASSASGVRRSAPVAATSAMHTCIWVSSLYSPGAKLKGPPPFISGNWLSLMLGWNS